MADISVPPDLRPPKHDGREPRLKAPAGACDTHFHIYEADIPLKPERRYTPVEAGLENYRRMAARLGLSRGVVVTGSAMTSNQPSLDAIAAMGGAFKGLAIFPGGEVAAHRYEGWFDLKDGSGRFFGYARWQFDDGSTIWAEYDGTVRMVTSTNFRIEAKLYDISGTGHFAGASGEGKFQGRRVESIESGGSTYLTGQLRLDLPG